ncbi:MAG: hypothetical protein MRJ96_09225 [Nitrospirales bacterium]|nr:hypothetical protein [Nitrospira sp.]MDR4501614.1 hypothetical protein [Nitrospirales bacterium]
MRTTSSLNSLILTCCVLFSGCSSSKPVLYPNQAYQEVGKEKAEQDIALCEELAEQYVQQSNKGEQVAGKTVIGGAAGAASGAVGGAITGNVGVGAAAGAAVGATYGLLRGIFASGGPEANPTYRKFVDRCLREKGYEPMGWD